MDENIYDVYKPTLDEVLTNALPSPSYVKPAGDAAVVALACHCEWHALGRLQSHFQSIKCELKIVPALVRCAMGT